MKKILLSILIFASIASYAQLTKTQLGAINTRDIKSSGVYSSFKTGKLNDSTYLSLLGVKNNLSDLNNAGTARTNLGLGSLATLSPGANWPTALAASLGSGWPTALNAAYSAGSGWALTGTTNLTGPSTIVGTSTNKITFNFNSLGTTQTDGAGLYLQNSVAAAAGSQQISPSITWEGQGWKTNATAASQSVKFKEYVTPIQSTGTPKGKWGLYYSINGQTDSTALSVTDNSILDTYTTINSTNDFSQRWNDNSGNVLMSFGSIGATNLGPALKLIGKTRSQDVELAITQTNTVLRDYGGYFIVTGTNSDMSWYTRNNNADTKAFTVFNGDASMQVFTPFSLSANIAWEHDFAGTSLFQAKNTNASGVVQMSFQNDVSNASIAAYGSSVGAFKILGGNDFHIYKPTSGNLNLLVDNATGTIRMAAGGGSNPQLTVAASGNIVLQSESIQSTSVTTAAGTTTLTNASNGKQVFTGSTTQTVVLPVVTTLLNGWKFKFINLSSGVVTVQTSGTNTVKAMAANSILELDVLDTTAGTGTASWNWVYTSSINN